MEGSVRIAFAHDSRRFDGLFVLLQSYRAALEGTRYLPSVYTCYDPSLRPEYPELGTMVPGHRIPGGGDLERGVNRLLPVFARRLRTIPEELVHLASVSLAGLLRYRTDVIVTVPDLAKRTTRYYPRVASYLHNRLLPLLPRARGIVCCTGWAAGEIARVLEIPPERIWVVPPGSIVPPAPGARRPDGPPSLERPRTILHVAVDRPHKNIAFFLRTLAELGPEYRARIVANPTRATQELAATLGVARRVSFGSGAGEMSAVYREADVLVFPSLHEGFGFPLLEAMGQGMPVIASDRTSVPEVVGAGGTILPPDDPRRWAEAIAALADPERYHAASRRALTRAGEFTRERTRTALVAAYERALA
jgi:glycosyltransferase involved in cell wall biosynthesis